MIDRIARLYRSRWLQGYARGKLRSDPVFGAGFDLLKDTPLPVLDVGCGIGLFEFYLRECGFAAPLHGIDFDAPKIAEAQRIATGNYSKVHFSVGDAGQALPGEAGHVVIFDVLHYLSADTQRELLERIAGQLIPGGICLVRETPRDRSWRFYFTQWEEWFIRAIFWMKSGAVYFPTPKEIIAPFEERGCTVEMRPLWGRTPFNSHLFVFRRR